MISVVIATRDRAPLLGATLEAVGRVEPPDCPYEIVVVDNGSTDATAETVERYARWSRAPVTFLQERRPGKSHALNTATVHARGDLLVLTDDDVLPYAGWLKAYARVFGDPRVHFAVGRILPLWEAPPPRWLSPAIHGVLAVPDGGDRSLPVAKGVNEEIMPLGANMALRRAVVDRIGGWNPELGKLQGTLRTGEDHEFALRMITAGFEGVYEPAASVQHRVPAERLRLSYFARWFFDNGTIEAGLEREYPTTARYLFGVPAHLWRQFVHDLVRASSGILAADVKRATAAGMRVVWFVGYLRGRWVARRRTTRVNVRPPACSRSIP